MRWSHKNSSISLNKLQSCANSSKLRGGFGTEELFSPATSPAASLTAKLFMTSIDPPFLVLTGHRHKTNLSGLIRQENEYGERDVDCLFFTYNAQIDGRNMFGNVQDRSTPAQKVVAFQVGHFIELSQNSVEIRRSSMAQPIVFECLAKRLNVLARRDQTCALNGFDFRL